jgi:hypothetical protein
MKLIHKIIFFTFLAISMVACNLEKEIDLDLPPFEAQLVVECYLEPGKPYRANIFKTTSYFAPAADLFSAVVTNATVIITHNGVADTLRPGIYVDADNFYAYGSNTIVPEDYTNDFFLEVIDTAGNRLTATTKIAQPVYLDSITSQPLVNDTSLLIVTFFPDDPTEDNFYRRLMYRTTVSPDSLKTDFVFDDRVTSNGQMTLGGPPSFVRGDTMIVQLVKMTEAFYNYVDSRERLESSNGNPFGQPGAIQTNIQGGIGIFTGYKLTRDTFYLN